MGRPENIKHNGPEGQSGCRSEGLPKGTNTCSLTSSAHLSDQSTRFERQPPPGGLSDRKTWPKMLLPTSTPRLRPGTRRKPAYRSCPTGTASTDWSHPTGDSRSEGTRGEWRKQRTKSRHGTRTILCTPTGTVLHNRPDTNSMGGTDICDYSIVGADIYVYSIVGAVGAPIRQKAPHMPLGIDSGHQDSPYLVHMVGLLIY